jgi:hypothetical protein
MLFNDLNTEEELKSQISFQLVNAIREAVTTALKSPQPITYERALNYLEDISPDIYNQVVHLLPDKNESDLIKYYKDLAKASPEQIEAKKLIEIDIEKHEELIAKSPLDHRFLENHRIKLKAALTYFKERSFSEHKLLQHDFYLASRGKLKLINEDVARRDYRLDDTRKLRINLLHPDKEESILGADLIYEQYDFKYNLVRFVHLQYKTWNSNVLYLNDERMGQQLARLQANTCACGFCKGNNVEKEDGSGNLDYRYPYCSAFLRPTNKVLKNGSKMSSTGMHIPICKVNKLKTTDGKITKENIKDLAISQTTFEELFNKTHIGSNWMPFGDLEDYYRKRKLNELSENVRIHAQEVINTYAEDR